MEPKATPSRPGPCISRLPTKFLAMARRNVRIAWRGRGMSTSDSSSWGAFHE